jgi:hypothetical protein
MLSGCVSAGSARGALIGALSGAVVGAGTGVLISDDKLLGSSKQSKIALQSGGAIGAATAVGAVVGAIVGAMVGHQRESGKPMKADEPAHAQAPRPAAF